jgi:hypothetical protein
MITLLAALIVQAHAIKPDPDHEICFYYSRGDYSQVEAKQYLKDAKINMDLKSFCKITPKDEVYIEEQQQCAHGECPKWNPKDIETKKPADIIRQMRGEK